jgi:hypothetical protein
VSGSSLLLLNIESKTDEMSAVRSSATAKFLGEVKSLVGGGGNKKTDNRRKRNIQSGCATWEKEAGLIAGGKL